MEIWVSVNCNCISIGTVILPLYVCLHVVIRLFLTSNSHTLLCICRRASIGIVRSGLIGNVCGGNLELYTLYSALFAFARIFDRLIYTFSTFILQIIKRQIQLEVTWVGVNCPIYVLIRIFHRSTCFFTSNSETSI